MTAGHRHRVVTVRTDAWYVRVLRYPLYVTRDQTRVNTSPYPYGPVDPPVDPPVYVEDQQWYLSLLGILHRWTGLTLFTLPAVGVEDRDG